MSHILVTFAVPEEARPFRRLTGTRPGVHILVTGIGATPATAATRQALAQTRPNAVLTCGFAGALHPSLQLGDVVLDADNAGSLGPLLRQLGARTARFHTAERVAVTASEKHTLHSSTGADAVEMESGAIRELCRNQGIPCATLRVISDTADEDLPLDFNQFLDGKGGLSLPAILANIAASPGRIPALLRFQRRTRLAADRLAQTLQRAVDALQR